MESATITRQGSRFRGRKLLGSIAALALPLIGWAASAPAAHADTTAPSIAYEHAWTGTGSVTIGPFTPNTSYRYALFVGANGSPGTAQAIRVSEGETDWPALAQISDGGSDPADGYAGVFTVNNGSWGSGSFDLSVSDTTDSSMDLWVAIVGFSNSGGFTGGSEASSTSGDPSLSISPSASSNELFFGIGSDWTEDVTATAPSGQTVEDSYADSGQGWSGWLIYQNSDSSGSNDYGSVGPNNVTGDEVNQTGIVVEGT